MARNKGVEQWVEEPAARVGGSMDADLMNVHGLQRLIDHLLLSAARFRRNHLVSSYQLRYPCLLCGVLRILELRLGLGFVKE